MRYAALALALLVSACAPAGPSAPDGGDASPVPQDSTAADAGDASDAAVHPLVGSWSQSDNNFRGFDDAGQVSGSTTRTLTFAADGTMEVTGSLVVEACQPHGERQGGRWRISGNRTLLVEGTECQLSPRTCPRMPVLNGCFLAAFIYERMEWEWTASATELRLRAPRSAAPDVVFTRSR